MKIMCNLSFSQPGMLTKLVILSALLATDKLQVVQHAVACSFSPSNTNDSSIATAKRTYFYVGGQYENATQYGLGSGSVTKGQMYVESLEPAQITKKWPIVMIEGAGQTGTNFLNTPDGRPGWASYFLNQGYHVYIVDQVARGRSPWLPQFDRDQNLTFVTTDHCMNYWTAVERYNLWPQAKYHTQWPGTGMPGDPVFDAFYAGQIQYVASYEYAERVHQRAGLALLEKIGPAILLTHSQSGAYAWTISEVAQPRGLVELIVALEPNGPPFEDQILDRGSGISRPYGLTTIPLTYSPPVSSALELKTITVPPPPGLNGSLSRCIQQDPTQPGGPRKLAHLQGIPVLLVTSEASYHAVYDYCIVKYLTDAGVNVTWFDLPKLNIFGNAHFMFMEKNSDVIADKIGGWLETNVI